MPGSVTSVETSPQILTYVFSVFGLVTSLMLTTVGYVNNEWIVLRNSYNLGEIQRGIRGHDCYKNITADEGSIKCLPWDFKPKSSKFPEPFDAIKDPSNLIYWSQYTAIIIFICQFAWLAYAIAQCCSSKAADYLKKHKLNLYRLYFATLFLFVLLYIFIQAALYFSEFFPFPMDESKWNKVFGNGLKTFLFGGLAPMLIAFICLFKEELRVAWNQLSLLCFGRRHQPLPNNETEMH